MSKRNKLRRKLTNNPIGVKFSELETLLYQFNFVLIRTSGSHHLYRHQFPPIVQVTIPVHGQLVKPEYVREVIRILDQIYPQIDNHESEGGNDDEK